MTRTVGVHEAKTHLSRLLADVAGGAEVVITSRGREVARLVPPPRPRTVGLDVGRLVVPEDFDSPLDSDLTALFGG